MITEVTGDRIGGRDYDHGGSNWAIFALIFLFALIALVFFRRDDRRGGFEDVAGVAMLGNLNRSGENIGAAAFTELNGRLDSLEQQISHSVDVEAIRDLKNSMCGLADNSNQKFFDISYQLQNNAAQMRYEQLIGCKDVERQNAENTCKIIESGNLNTRNVLDAIKEDTISRLKDQLADARLAASQFRQDLLITQNSDRVIGALRTPPPIPAYLAGMGWDSHCVG